MDATYGVGGRALTPVPSFFIQGGLLAVDAQNRAVVCGVVEDGYFATRLLENGQVDPSFGNAGIAVGMPDSGLTQDIQTALALPGNKTLIVLNAYGQDTVDETRLLVLDASGQLDPTFGVGGLARYDFNPGTGEEYFTAGVVQPDGKIVLAGFTISPTADLPQGLVVRLNPDGTLDPTFGSGGRFDAPVLLVFSLFSSIRLQPDGKLVLSGSTADLSTFAFLGIMLRLNANGQLDFTFGSAGVVRLSTLASRLNFIADMARASDGKWVIAGTSFPQFDTLRVARLNANGSLDNTFGISGVSSLLPANLLGALPSKCRIQPDGRIVTLATAIIDSTESGYLLVRMNANGQLDTTFGSGGVVLEKNNQLPSDLALQATDNKILVSGIYDLSVDQGFFVHRYNNKATSVKETRLNVEAVRLFPNPAREQATVQFTLEAPLRLQMDLIDLQGRIVSAVTPMRAWDAGAHAYTFELPQMPVGLHWLRLRDEQGRAQVVPLTVAPR